MSFSKKSRKIRKKIRKIPEKTGSRIPDFLKFDICLKKLKLYTYICVLGVIVIFEDFTPQCAGDKVIDFMLDGKIIFIPKVEPTIFGSLIDETFFGTLRADHFWFKAKICYILWNIKSATGLNFILQTIFKRFEMGSCIFYVDWPVTQQLVYGSRHRE